MIASILALVATPASASATVTTKRYSGLDRYATAAAVAEATYATATKAILVSGENFADGLSASVLSGAAGAPVFLTQAAALPAVTAAAMGRVMTTNKTIYVVGGVNAVGAGVVTTLTGLGYTVTRIAGADRASTAVAVANKAKEFSALGTHTSLNTAIVVSDTAFADAVVAGGLSESGLYPILLTNGTSLTAATKAAFATTSLNIKQVIIVGGTSAVSASVEAEILADSNVSSIIRIGGTNRQDTAKKFAEKLTGTVASGGFAWSKAKATIVTSNGFADALASAQFNGTNNSVLLYTADNVPAETSAYVSSATVKAALTNVYAIGGTSAVPADVLASVDTLGTYATSAVTIGAAEGSNVVTVTFPALMKTADMVLAKVKINNAAIDNTQDVALNGAFCTADYAGTIKLAVAAHTFKVGNMVRASCHKAGPAAILQGDLAYNAATTAKVDVVSPVLATTATTVTIAATVAAGAAAGGTLSTMVDACVKSSGNATATGYKVMTCYLDVPVSAGDTINVAGIGDLATGTSNKSTTVTVANSTLDPSCASQVHYAGAAAT
jgi:putative cell wall-binding protein